MMGKAFTPPPTSPPAEGELILRTDQWPALIAGDPEEAARRQARSLALQDPALLFMPEALANRPEHILSAVLVVSRNTRRAYRADWMAFVECCRLHHQQALPATIPALLTFIEWRSPYVDPGTTTTHGAPSLRVYRYVTQNMPRSVTAPASLKRALTAISTLHRWLALPDMTSQETVKQAIKMHCQGRLVQKQKAPLLWNTIAQALQNMGTSLREQRDKALVAVAHSTMFRRAELRLLTVEQYRRDAHDETGVMVYAKTKNEDEDHLKSRCVTPAAVEHLEAWLQRADITSGYLFRGIDPGGRLSDQPLSDRMIALIFKKIGRAAGLSEDQVAMIGGHSTRIGAAHDLDDAGFPIQSIATEGGWKTIQMPMRYIDGRRGKHGAMAKFGRRRTTPQE